MPVDRVCPCVLLKMQILSTALNNDSNQYRVEFRTWNPREIQDVCESELQFCRKARYTSQTEQRSTRNALNRAENSDW